ncbi:uncharacterized protein LOC114461660 [Gouania willdenowi]|uniref:uncharacterized protein LOC114461660 n=1 Tax=Gouania willdenowi TaxID=441366 RepID=UPI00105499B2|nr:uncharacterized protein LOC114461660 [Gouania willdenowi]
MVTAYMAYKPFPESGISSNSHPPGSEYVCTVVPESELCPLETQKDDVFVYLSQWEKVWKRADCPCFDTAAPVGFQKCSGRAESGISGKSPGPPNHAKGQCEQKEEEEEEASVLSASGHHCSVASLCSSSIDEQKGRLLCAHIKGGPTSFIPTFALKNHSDLNCCVSMDYKAILISFVLLSFHTLSVCGDGFVLMPVELAPVPCNDKAVGKLSRLAVTYINEDRTEGYKFALNRVANVHLHAQGPAGNVYYLDLDVLETKCHTGSPKPWKRCDVRPFMETQVSGNCNTTILHTPEGYSYLYSYDCALVPDSPENLQKTCPTCPTLLSVDSPEAMRASGMTLASYKRKSTLGVGLGVKKITRAAVQKLPVKAYFVEYTVQDCPEGITERATCQRITIDSDTETAGFCTGSLHGDLYDHPEAHVSCELFKAQNVDVLRPVEPQGHDFPTFPPQTDDHGNDPNPIPSESPLPTVVQPEPSAPAPIDHVLIDPAPIDPSPAVNPSTPLPSSSSESEESFLTQQRRPSLAESLFSSSEEIVGLVARRPPLNFRYQRRERRKRQALQETSPSYNPVFLADFPNGTSPFRSCPGPARYTTV